MPKSSEETFVALSTLDNHDMIGWARGSLDGEGIYPLAKGAEERILSSLGRFVYAERPDIVRKRLQAITKGSGLVLPEILPCNEHPDIKEASRTLDRATRIEIGLRADQYASGTFGARAQARRLAAIVSMMRAFSEFGLQEHPPMAKPAIPQGKVVSIQGMRLRKTIQILNGRFVSATTDPDLGWLAKGLADALETLHAELREIEETIENR